MVVQPDPGHNPELLDVEFCEGPKAARPNILFDPARLAPMPRPDGKLEAGVLWGKRVAAIIAAWMRRLVDPGRVIEVRAIKARVGGSYYTSLHPEIGFWDYDHLQQMAEEVLKKFDCTCHPGNQAQGIYYTVNPLISDIQARCANRFMMSPKKGKDEDEDGVSAKDEHVLHRRWILIDFDPIRRPLNDSKISTTDAEKADAYKLCLEVREYLRARHWPEPVLCDSGNGYHLLYPVDLPTNDGGVVERVLKCLADRFDNDFVKIDRKVFNPSRLCKIPGTMACKGDAIAGRPHRRSCVLEMPQEEVPEQ